ncbi:MAG TPA: hypothetical protein VMN37_11120, partial [Gemmatimonadales bacterium]|nr:hypothetical protein [Gemmatimonadales bacterium]
MDLRLPLRDTLSLADLPRLVAALGHEPLWDRRPPVAGGARPDDGAMVVGRTGELPWLAVEAA